MLEPNGAAEVEYVQMKKMKKRRELDALVTNGKAKMGIGKRKKKGHHELLQNQDSGSSEIDEFSIDTEKAFVRNRGRRTESKVCSRCITVVTCLLSVLCIIACAGLAWVHIELKKDLDSVRVKLSKVETKTKGTVIDDKELQKQVKTVFQSLTKAGAPFDLEKMKKSFDEGVKEATKDLTKKVTELEGEVERLKESVESAPALKALPDKVDTLTQSVATVKGDLRTVSDLVKSVSDKEAQLEKNSKVIQQRLAVMESRGVSVDKKQNAETTVGEGNDKNLTVLSTVQASLKTIQDAVSSNRFHLEHLDNVTEGLTLRLELLEQQGSHNTATDQSTVPDWASIVNTAVEKALEKVSNKSIPISQSVNSSTAVSGDALNQLTVNNSTAVSGDAINQLTQHMANISSQLVIYKSEADQMRHDFNLAHSSQDSSIFNATQSELITKILYGTLEDYKNKYNMDVQAINESVQSLGSALQTLTVRVTSNNAQIIALATTIQQLAQSSVHNVLMPGPALVTGESRGPITGEGDDNKTPYNEDKHQEVHNISDDSNGHITDVSDDNKTSYKGRHQEVHSSPSSDNKGHMTDVSDDKSPYGDGKYQEEQYNPASGNMDMGESRPAYTGGGLQRERIGMPEGEETDTLNKGETPAYSTGGLQRGRLGMSEGEETGTLNRESGMKHEHGDVQTEAESADDVRNKSIWPEENYGTSQDIPGHSLGGSASNNKVGKGSHPVKGVKANGGKSKQQIKFHVGDLQGVRGNSEVDENQLKTGAGHVDNIDYGVGYKEERKQQNYGLPPGDSVTDMKGKVGHGMFSDDDDDVTAQHQAGGDHDQNGDLHAGRDFGQLGEKDSLPDEPVEASDIPDPNSGAQAPSTEVGMSQEVSNDVTKKPNPNVPTTLEPEGTTRKIVKFWSYDTPQKLEVGHSRWDKNGDGKVDPADLPDFFGPHITEEDLDNYRKFDMDNDGLLNLDETMMAAGFNPPSKQEDTTEKLSGVLDEVST